jgi:hypothetical protein
LIFYVDGLLETKNSQAVCSDDIWQSRTHSYTKYFSVSQDTMDQEHKAYINLSLARKVNVPSCSIFASSFPSIILMLIQKFRCIFCFIAHNQDFIKFVAHIRVRMSTTVLYARPFNSQRSLVSSETQIDYSPISLFGANHHFQRQRDRDKHALLKYTGQT